MSSVRRSSRIKKLDLDESARERILFEQPTVRVDQRRGMEERGPYARKDVDRLLKHQAVHGQQQGQQTEGVEPSPIRNVFGLLSGKIQDLMKGIFPKFRLFTEDSGIDAQVTQDASLPQVTQAPQVTQVPQEPKAPSLRASRSMHASLEAIKPTDDVEVRRTAYAELASFFAEHRRTPMNPLDVPKIVGLVNRTAAAAPIRLGRATSTSAVMATPLPRKVMAMGTPSVLSKMPSLPRIQVPPSTQLKFRTVQRAEPVAEEPVSAHAPSPLDLEQEVKQEFERSVSGSIQGSPMKVSVQVEPPVKMEKKDGPIPNRFVGLFYLDPDEEEEELLLQERKATEQQKRIDVLAARKTQREKRISFRDKKVDVEPEVKKMVFDFGSAGSSKEEVPLINLGAPAKEESEGKPASQFDPPTPTMAQKPAPTFSFDLPSAATKLPTPSQEQKRKRSLVNEEVKPFAFTLPEKPKFSFKPTTDEPSIPDSVPPVPAEKPVVEEGKKEVLPVFSFKQPDETKPAFPSMASGEGKVTFSFESKPATEAPKFSFGAASIPAHSFGSAAAEKPTFGFAAPTSATADKPTFGTVTADKPAPVFGAPQGEMPSFSFVVPSAEKASPVFDTKGTADKPSSAFGTGKPPAFTFGAAPEAAFGTGGDAKPSFTFGTPSSSEAAKTPIIFGAAQPELKATTVGAPTSKVEEPKPLSFGLSSAFGSAPASLDAKPTFGFGVDAPKFSFSTDAGKPSPFTFPGATKTEEAKEQPKSAFSFQFSGPTPATSEPPKFSFGAPTQNKPFAFSQPAPATTTGDDSMMEDNVPVAPAPASTASPFTFTGASPAFNANAPAVAPFSFANAAPSPTPSSRTPTFGFGSPALGAQSAFTFGQGNPTASATTPQPFTFGQASGTTAPFTFGQPPIGMDALANAAMVDPNKVGFNMGAANTTGKKGPVSRPRRR